ncbi:enolase-phosphatase E1 [Zalaria obscura]|uniref:Enolase-phosphatase E1 n=1 Tax=Zalaria obscura TaxID=2024903 RepID=A0ACC3S9V1_9PEZI
MTSHYDDVKTVVLDIEGTICPISFVKETLFPYALQALPSVLASRWDSPDFRPYRDAFPEEARSSPEAFEAHVKDLTARDIKIAYLKNLQGYLWQAGYEDGAYSSPFFPDVIPQLRQWKASAIQLVIYSSGSVFAQKLLFGHIKDTTSDDPKATVDLRDLISDWFDTTNAGLKMEATSYSKIAEVLGQQPAEILFFSDNVKEVQTAEQAGMKAVIVDRPGNAPLSEEDKKGRKVVEALDEISLSPAQIDARFWKR